MAELAGLLENENDFLEAAKRCGLSRLGKDITVTEENAPLLSLKW